MRFANTLQKSIYAPWKDYYIDYQKLKVLLRETDAHRHDDDAASSWTENDEENFVQELINVQLDKVNAFQVETYARLREQTATVEAKLEPLTLTAGRRASSTDAESTATSSFSDEQRKKIAEDALKELDSISNEVNLLEKYCRINFTGFLKAAKKHDRRRGTFYKVRPLLQVRLAELPFDSEDYSPFLYRLSTMYAFARQTLGEIPTSPTTSDGPALPVTLGQDKSRKETHSYASYKFWVHQDNLLEVKTLILRRLPVLVYSSDVSSREVSMPLTDPSFTSLYFDSPRFKLYNQRVDRGAGSTLRLWWRGFLADNPHIYLEYIKTGEDDRISGEVRLPIKEKHIMSFIKGESSLEKHVCNMCITDVTRGEALQKDIAELQKMIRDDELQPVLRATYSRTAFQIPGDDRIRVSLDTDVATIREDALDLDRPCRDPDDWHRRDIDSREMTYPFSEIRPGEITRFPHALLEIRIRDDARKGTKEWLADLMRSHLVKESPRFSKFVHGVAELFEDHVNIFPFWLSELDTDIRRDPEDTQNERERKRHEDHIAAGSFVGSLRIQHRIPGPDHSTFGEALYNGPPRRSITLGPSDTASLLKAPVTSQPPRTDDVAEGTSSEVEVSRNTARETSAERGGIRKYFRHLRPGRRHREEAIRLPPGVEAPETWIKDAGPLRVEAKVWLANQRTFIKWQHISVLLATLSVGLYNAAKSRDDRIASYLAIIYICFAVFAGVWGYTVYIWRSNLIRKRSGKDFDNVAGPMIVCLGLAVALVMNFWLKYSEFQRRRQIPDPSPLPDRPLWAWNVTSPAMARIEDEYVLVNQAALLRFRITSDDQYVNILM
ncbi:Phosphate metabolism transcription protein [Ascosphaera aggregata]|nr:Phosphate metabolism transcription protein [Ascosphaera aggregata]